MRKLRSALLALSFIVSVASQAAYDPTHALFTQILARDVQNGVVNYANLKNSPQLEQYLGQIASVNKESFNKMGREEQMAYLINAYNAFTLKMISDFYPVESIRDIGGKVGGNFFNKGSKQWKVSEYELNGKKVSFVAMGAPITLDQIEHDNLRPKFQDARVHFALVCGAVSCPFLRSEAYTGAKLNEQLDAQGRQFLADPFRNRYDESKKTLFVSQIFKWFKEDFTRKGKLIDFLRPFLAAELQSKVGEKTDIEYITYDWSLNSKPGKI